MTVRCTECRMTIGHRLDCTLSRRAATEANTRRRAGRTAAHFATDSGDLATLLDMLGITAEEVAGPRNQDGDA